MSKRIRQPALETRPGFRLSNQETTVRPDDQRPVFSFEHLVKGHSVKDCEKRDQAALALKLQTLSQLTWGEIKLEDRHKNGFEKIPCDIIKAPKPAVITPDVTLIAFRYSGLKPMVGFRKDRIFYIVWLDKNFKLYDHG